jgi:hypothetical protein
MSGKIESQKALPAGGDTSWASELGKLSRDPDITRYPDPAIHVGFHDPDELGEDETAEYVVGGVAQTRRAVVMHSDSWLRRSPKE